MADCSKTVDFFKERSRLCTSNIDECSECPLSLKNNGTGMFCEDIVRVHIDKAAEIVQKWSDEHPEPKPKTYADDFFEKFPKATRYRCGETDVPSFCIDNFYGLGKRSSCSLKCHGCWNEPYTEQEAFK